jgi:hypothetical protein
MGVGQPVQGCNEGEVVVVATQNAVVVVVQLHQQQEKY